MSPEINLYPLGTNTPHIYVTMTIGNVHVGAHNQRPVLQSERSRYTACQGSFLLDVRRQSKPDPFSHPGGTLESYTKPRLRHHWITPLSHLFYPYCAVFCSLSFPVSSSFFWFHYINVGDWNGRMKKIRLRRTKHYICNWFLSRVRIVRCAGTTD